MLRQLIADLFITVNGHASGRDAPAFFGHAGPDLTPGFDVQCFRRSSLRAGRSRRLPE
jgi:hypothetical protein